MCFKACIFNRATLLGISVYQKVSEHLHQAAPGEIQRESNHVSQPISLFEHHRFPLLLLSNNEKKTFANLTFFGNENAK